MAKFIVTAAEPQKNVGKGRVQKFRCTDQESEIDYPHVVQIWNHEVKVGDVLEGTIEEKTSIRGDKTYINHQFKKAGGGFGGGGYKGPTAEQYARGQAMVILSFLYPDEKEKRDAYLEPLMKKILG